MAEGNDTYYGLAVPLHGESEIKQTPGDEAIDILTITGSTGTQTGDFIVCQSGAGTEAFVVSSSGLITTTAGITGLSGLSLTLSSTAANGITVNITSTGAIAAGAIVNNAVLVSMSTKANLNAVFAYSSGGTSEVGVANTLLAIHGSKAPTYFLQTDSTGTATAASGFYIAPGTRFVVTTGGVTTTNLGWLTIMSGTAILYIPCYPSTGTA